MIRKKREGKGNSRWKRCVLLLEKRDGKIWAETESSSELFVGDGIHMRWKLESGVSFNTKMTMATGGTGRFSRISPQKRKEKKLETVIAESSCSLISEIYVL